MEINQERIEQALTDNEFYLEYLPTIELSTGNCVGAEALIRWKQQGKIIFPDQFIPLIENTHLSGPITYWVVDTVINELRDWLDKSSAHIAINVPPEILGRGGIPYALHKAGALKFHQQFILEVSEGELLINLR